MTSFPAGMPRSLRYVEFVIGVGLRNFLLGLGFNVWEKREDWCLRIALFFCLQFLALDCERRSLPISRRASVPFFLAFERIPVCLSHFQQSCDSQVLPIASRKREPLRSQK